MDRLVVRPKGPRIVGYVSVACLVAMFIAIAWALPPDIRSQFTWEQTATLIFFIGFIAFLLHGVARSRVEADEIGLVVVNAYRKHQFAWDEVDAVGYKDGAPWPEARLKSGGRVILFGIQSADGKVAREAVYTIRGFLS